MVGLGDPCPMQTCPDGTVQPEGIDCPAASNVLICDGVEMPAGTIECPTHDHPATVDPATVDPAKAASNVLICDGVEMPAGITACPPATDRLYCDGVEMPTGTIECPTHDPATEDPAKAHHPTTASTYRLECPDGTIMPAGVTEC